MFSKLINSDLLKVKPNLFLYYLSDTTKSSVIYKMRNSKLMRANSINKEKIDLNKHHIWFDEFIKTNKIYLIKYHLVDIGYLRLEFLNKNKIEISIFIKAIFHKKGFASSILNFAISIHKPYIFLARVLKKNLISENFFRKNNFSEKSNKRKLFIIS